MPADTQAVSLDAVALFDIGLGPYMLQVIEHSRRDGAGIPG